MEGDNEDKEEDKKQKDAIGGPKNQDMTTPEKRVQIIAPMDAARMKADMIP